MSLYRKILLATDASDAAERARKTAVLLARATGAELHVLHVNVVSGLFARYKGLETSKQYVKQLEQASKKMLAAVPDEEGITIKRAVRTDESSGNAILRFAEDEGVDLIVVGNEGHGAVKRTLVGSVTTKVLRASQGPVLVAGRHRNASGRRVAPPSDIKHIVAGTDLSPKSAEALRHAARLASALEAELTVLYVVEPSLASPYDVGMVLRDTDTKKGRKALDDFLSGLSLELKPKAKVLVGPAHNKMAEFAIKEGAQLIVVSAHGHSAVERALFGSTPDKLVRIAECPVLVHRLHRKKR